MAAELIDGKAIARQLRDDVARAVEVTPDRVEVTLTQKARGGITVAATA